MLYFPTTPRYDPPRCILDLLVLSNNVNYKVHFYNSGIFHVRKYCEAYRGVLKCQL